MPTVAEMNPYLMCPPGLKLTLHNRYITEILDDLIMSHRRFSLTAVRKYLHDLPVTDIPPYMTGYRTF